jgi:hypothetical protein
VENGFGLNRFFRAVNAFAVVQCNESAAAVSAHFAETYLALLYDTISWGEMTLDDAPRKYFFQFCRAAFQGPVLIFCSVHLSQSSSRKLLSISSVEKVEAKQSRCHGWQLSLWVLVGG